jgi:ATP-binding cassette, subfamily A (ABC1), member 3
MLVAICGATIPLVFVKGIQVSCVTRFAPSINQPLYLPDLFAQEASQSAVTTAAPDTPSASASASATSTVSPAASATPTPPGIIISPPGALTGFFPTNSSILPVPVQEVQDNSSFVSYINRNYRNITFGGVSFDLTTNATLVAWEGTSPGMSALYMLNLADNILYNSALGGTGNRTIIHANYEAFPPVAAGSLVALKWNVFFSVAMVSGPSSIEIICH